MLQTGKNYGSAKILNLTRIHKYPRINVLHWCLQLLQLRTTIKSWSKYYEKKTILIASPPRGKMFKFINFQRIKYVSSLGKVLVFFIIFGTEGLINCYIYSIYRALRSPWICNTIVQNVFVRVSPCIYIS